MAFFVTTLAHNEEVMITVNVHANMWKRQTGSLVWYEGCICLEEVGGQGRMPSFKFSARVIEGGHFAFRFTEENAVLLWMYSHAQLRAWRVTKFLIGYAKALMHVLEDEPDGANTGCSWQCGPEDSGESAMLNDALNCIPIAHIVRKTPEPPEA